MTDQWQVLYGTGDGVTWFVLRGLMGKLPPDEIDGAPLLGETTEVIRSVLAFRMGLTRRVGEASLEKAQRVHETFAHELGITEERLTEFANDTATPDLPSVGWAKLTKAYYFIRPPVAAEVSGR